MFNKSISSDNESVKSVLLIVIYGIDNDMEYQLENIEWARSLG